MQMPFIKYFDAQIQYLALKYTILWQMQQKIIYVCCWLINYIWGLFTAFLRYVQIFLWIYQLANLESQLYTSDIPS